MRSKNKIVIIVGSGGKVGSNFVHNLLEDDYTVIGVRRGKSEILRESYYHVSFDASKSGLFQVIEPLLTKLEHSEIGIVWNARGITNAGQSETHHEFKSKFDSEMELGVVSALGFVDNLLEKIISKPVSLVLISSIYGIAGPRMSLYRDPAHAAGIQYGLVKSAQIHLVKELSVRYGRGKLRANSISYGGVEGRVDDDFLQRYSNLCPSGRMLKDEDLYGPLKFLLSKESSGVNGHNLVVDGGWTIA